MKLDAVFEGGGVRGVAYAGAVSVFEQNGAQWQRLAGTSAGAIAAALLAVGARARDLLQILAKTDFRSFLDARLGRRAWDTFRHLGLYRGDRFEQWLEQLVGTRTLVQTSVPLTVITCDMRQREILALSGDTHPEMPIARAVRMSMSIPFVFRAVRWTDRDLERVCVDGGLVENYPIERFDVLDRPPRWPTVGFLLQELRRHQCDCSNAVELACSMFSATRDAQARKITEHNAYRTVSIPDAGISWLQFGLTEEQKHRLVYNGREAATQFLAKWGQHGGLSGYIKRFR
jgi:NTE family protein